MYLYSKTTVVVQTSIARFFLIEILRSSIVRCVVTPDIYNTTYSKTLVVLSFK